MYLLKKSQLASMAVLATLARTACASGTLPGENSNGSVGGPDRITADATNGSVFGFSTNSDSKDHCLADAVREKLANLCSGGKRENISLDVKTHLVFRNLRQEHGPRDGHLRQVTFFREGDRPPSRSSSPLPSHTVKPFPDPIAIVP